MVFIYGENKYSQRAFPHEKQAKYMKKLNLDEGDISKMDILKKRFMFSEDIDVIRYLLTEAVEKVAEEIIKMETIDKQEKKHLKSAVVNAAQYS